MSRDRAPRRMAAGGRLRAALILLLLLPPARAGAAVFDEFEVHGTDIAAPGRTGFDLFVAHGLRGIRRPAWHGALAGDRATYLSPMLSHGVARWWETALLTPMAIAPGGGFHLGGGKWHNVLVLPGGGPWHVGTVVEVMALSRRFQPMTFGWELRPLVQYSAGRLDARLTLGVTGGFGRQDRSSVSPSLTLLLRTTDRLSLGIEHYAELGRAVRFDPLPGQAHQLFGVATWQAENWFLRIGVGRGLTPASEPWVVSARIAFGL